jgi:hypothetical protein
MTLLDVFLSLTYSYPTYYCTLCCNRCVLSMTVEVAKTIFGSKVVQHQTSAHHPFCDLPAIETVKLWCGTLLFDLQQTGLHHYMLLVRRLRLKGLRFKIIQGRGSYHSMLLPQSSRHPRVGTCRRSGQSPILTLLQLSCSHPSDTNYVRNVGAG